MHEFLLYSQVAHRRHSQVSHLLAGVSGSRPVDIREQHLVYQQRRPTDVHASRKAQSKPQPNQPQRLAYQQLIRDLSLREDEVQPSAWRLRTEELPEPGVKTVISRASSETSVGDADLLKFQSDSEWYSFVKQFIVSGTRFISGNVIVRVTQIMVPFQANTDNSFAAAVPGLEDLRPLDPSGAYLVEMCIRIDDGASSSLRDKAIAELTALKGVLEGAIDLKVPDRLALDTRVKAS